MKIIRDKASLTEAIRGLKAEGKAIGLVPTMGALHDGHISLIEIARRQTQAVVASIFVNPTQFGPAEDFSKYPRTESEDVARLQTAQIEIAYLPTVEDMYPRGSVTRVHVPGLVEELDGAFRPGHFDGVATIVTKLFMQVQPDVAIFGEKDYQQLLVIRQFVRDLDISVRIVGAPILREADGLAMSSRNRYLSESQRRIASSLHRILQQAGDKLRNKQPAEATLKQAREMLFATGFTKVDYVELRDSVTLAPAHDLTRQARLLAAAYLGTTRLIDNIEV